MEKELKAPKLRFPGFTDDWEQRKLKELGELTSSKRIHVSDYVDNGIPFYRGKEITELKENKTISEPLYISENSYQELSNKYGVPKIGELLITAVGTIGNTWVIDKTPFYFKDGNLIWFKKIKCDANYLDCVLSSPIGQKLIDDSASGSNQKALTIVKLNEIEIKLPALDEQKKISLFFSMINNLITLHQRKLDTLKKLKKGFLQKMFPKNGESVPEIRFPGFTDAWEQRKFGDVFNEYSEKKHPELPALTIIQGTGTILRDESDRKLQYDKASLVNYKLVNKDDLIVHLRSFEGGLEKANSEGIVSPAYHIFHGENTDTRFYYPFFRSRRFIDVLLKPHVYGIRDGKSIDIEGMKTISIPVPSYEEQEKVGDFIEKLDNLITLHQRKLDTLKKFKQGMLQQMFI